MDEQRKPIDTETLITAIAMMQAMPDNAASSAAAAAASAAAAAESADAVDVATMQEFLAYLDTTPE